MSRFLTKKVLASSAKPASKQKLKPAPESSDSEDQFAELEDEENVELDSDDDEDDDDEDDEEEDDVTPAALERMMQLLGDDVDPQDLEALGTLGHAEEGESDEDDEDFEDDDEDEDEDEDEEEGDDEDAEAEERLFEDLQDEDGDVVPVERTTVNDKAALLRVLASFKTDTTFFDTLSLTYPIDLVIPDAENDLSRELEFYKQSLWAATHASSLYAAASLPFTRPADYFAEMLKTDAHMSLIRQSLLDEAAGIKASEDARKLRDAKKFGKKVQVERLKEREKDKKEVGKRLEGLKKKRKSADGGFATTEDFDIALEDAISGPSKKRAKPNESERGGRGGRGNSRGITRRGRDAKFGNPTSSRRPKENNDKMDFTATGESRGGGRGGRGGARGGRGGRGGAGGGRGAQKGSTARAGAKRMGKSRRN